jgi:hypothetical protein
LLIDSKSINFIRMLLLERDIILWRTAVLCDAWLLIIVKAMQSVVAPQVAVDILESIVRQEVEVCSIRVKVRCLEYQSISGSLVI